VSTTVDQIIQEMRRTAYQIDLCEGFVSGAQINVWADALEAAMREPFAWWVDHPGWDASRNTLGGYAVRFKPDTDRPGRTVAPLFAFPPDAEEEIRYLRGRLADATKANDLFQTATDAEIERLREALQQIANRAIPIQREEHRIARTALAKESAT
jgi:hypothetical protein